MKLNIACPTTGGQKIIDVDDDKKLRIFYDMRIAQEVDATPLGDEFAGYILRITGGNDKDGFPMKQGVLCNHRVRLLLKPHTVGFRRGTHDGERKRRTVRGCIVAGDLSVLNLVVVKKGEKDIDGLTNNIIPRRVGPKRASKIRKLYNLSKEDDVRQFVVTRKRDNKKNPEKPHIRAPKVQRLVTSRSLQHRRRLLAIKRQRWIKASKEAAEYSKLIADINAEHRKRHEEAKEKAKRTEKIRKMMAILKAVAQRRRAAIAAKREKVAKVEAYRKLKAANLAKKKKPVTFVPKTKEQIEKHMKRATRERRKAYLKARAALHYARAKAMTKIRKEKKLRRRLVEACLRKQKTPEDRKKLIAQRIAVEKRAKAHRFILSKKGAVKFLGENARPYGKKARNAKKAAKRAAKAEQKK